MSNLPNSGFGLVVKTDSYTGNFEREFCAYATGKIGECEVGDDCIQESYSVDFDNVMDVADEYGCYRPVSLDEINPDNLIIFFEDMPTNEQIDAVKEATKTFNHFRKNESRMAEFYNDQDDIQFLGYEVREYCHTTAVVTEV